LIQRVQAEPFAAKQIELLQREVPNLPPISSSDAKSIASLLKFTAEQVQTLKLLFPKVTDRHNFVQALEVISFQSERDNLKRELGL
jgi:hypothetical protein